MVALLIGCSDPSGNNDAAVEIEEEVQALASLEAPYETLSYTFCANEFTQCTFKGEKVVRFGAAPSSYKYAKYSNGVSCDFRTLGDPAPGKTKTCSIADVKLIPAPTVPDAGAATVYVQCATEFQQCEFKGTKTVRFGTAPNLYTYTTITDGVQCSFRLLGDPAPGKTKTCAIQTSVAPLDAGVPVTKPDAAVPVVVKDAGATPVVVPTPVPTTSKRPSYNKGVGFYVLNGKLYDANDKEFVIRGVNKVHWDNGSEALLNAKPNTTRWTMDFNQPPANNIKLLLSTPGRAGTVTTKNVVIPGNWDGTCQEDPAYLTRMTDTWVAQAAEWTKLEKYSIINIANEWGPGDSTVWRDSYITAVARLRAAGYHATISVTSGGCGQDPYDIVKYGQAVFNSDPEKNVIFDQHVYGYYGDPEGGATGGWSNMPSITKQFHDLAATGLVVMIGEFGPGRNIGPSPTDVTPDRVMQVAQENGLGWLAWAADDGDSSNCDGNWFCLFKNTSVYNTSNDLTVFGKSVVENPTYGLKVTAKTCSIF